MLSQLEYPAKYLDYYMQGYDNPAERNPYLATSTVSDLFLIGQHDAEIGTRPCVDCRPSRGHTYALVRDFGTNCLETLRYRVESGLVLAAETAGAR